MDNFLPFRSWFSELRPDRTPYLTPRYSTDLASLRDAADHDSKEVDKDTINTISILIKELNDRVP